MPVQVCREGKSIDIPYARNTRNLCLEVGLVIAIGRNAPEARRDSRRGSGMIIIYGYGAGIDFTKRDWQNILREHRQPWELAKGFDASAVISEIRDKHRMPDMDEAVLWLYVNNQERQRGNTKERSGRFLKSLTSFLRISA